MYMNEEKIKEINKAYRAKRTAFSGTDIAITNSCNGTGIKKGIMVFCNIDEISQVISELTDLRAAIEEETGVRF